MESSGELETTVFDDAPSTLVADPNLTQQVADAPSANAALPLGGSVDYGLVGTSNYDHFPIAATATIKSDETILVSSPANTIYRNVINIKDLFIDRIATNYFVLYEAFMVLNLSLIFQESANCLEVANSFWCHYVQDPYRKAVMPVVSGSGAVQALEGGVRYGTTIMVRQGDNVTWNVPISKNKFYTVDNVDERFSKPGNLFIDSTSPVKFPQIVTIVGEVAFYCPTRFIARTYITQYFTGGLELADNLIEITFPSIDRAVVSGLFVPEDPRLMASGVVYLMRPVPFVLTWEVSVADVPTKSKIHQISDIMSVLRYDQSPGAPDNIRLSFDLPAVLEHNPDIDFTITNATIAANINVPFMLQTATQGNTHINKYLVKQ